MPAKITNCLTKVLANPLQNWGTTTKATVRGSFSTRQEVGPEEGRLAENCSKPQRITQKWICSQAYRERTSFSFQRDYRGKVVADGVAWQFEHNPLLKEGAAPIPARPGWS
jgi:hypothetical protein